MQTVQIQIRLLLEEQSDQGLHCLHSIKYFKKQLHKKREKKKAKEVWNKVLEILGHLQ